MRKVVLYIAMSLDGCIADRRGGVGWLAGQDGGGEEPDGYSAFIKGIDTVVMGWNTYHQIVTELSPEEWVYAGLTSYVVTHRKMASTDEIIFTGQDPRKLVRELRREPGKGIWICGGGKIIEQLVREDLIDEYDISVIPVILGGGIRLFGEAPEETKVRLAGAKVSGGIAELVYTRRRDGTERGQAV